MYRNLLKNTSEYKRLASALSSSGASALFGLPSAGRVQFFATLAKDNGETGVAKKAKNTSSELTAVGEEQNAKTKRTSKTSKQKSRKLCIVCPTEAIATKTASDLTALGVSSAVFPARDLLLRQIESTAHEFEYRRLNVLGGLVSGRIQAVCVSAEALLQYTVPMADFCENTLTLKTEMNIDRESLIARLFSAGYTRRHQVDGAGQFSVRGDIVDIYPPEQGQPARVEFWDDEIDTISTFDLTTQRRIDGDFALSKLHISPAREILFGDCETTLKALQDFLKAATGKKRTKLEFALAQDLAQLENNFTPSSMDKYLSVRYKTPATLLDYFEPENSIFILEEFASIRDAQKATEFRRGEEIKALLEDGSLTAELANFYEHFDFLLFNADKYPSLICENFVRSIPDIKLKELVDSPAHALPTWNGRIEDLCEDLDPLLAEGYAVTILAGTPKATTAIIRDLSARNYNVSASHDAKPMPKLVQVVAGHLSGGCAFPFAHCALITSRHHGLEDGTAKSKRKKNKDALSSLSDIKNGDYVVHQDHGIGLYSGIERLTVDGTQKDYLKVQYHGTDTLYVPVTQLDLLSRYTAPGDSDKVRLAKLGGVEWQKTRKKVKKATEAMAQELIELYARRQKAHGFAFLPDSDWQSDFEARFEYEETEDQLLTTAEIKEDMEKPMPMDRLLCGDVGVGKTEVALRAAFKAVLSGKQVAILAPTTILAWQHYNGMLSRMEAFPVKIGLLNRFRTAREQKLTLGALRRGEVDIIVGTHRLLSKDVIFKDLGLVIIDEEQRFGVKHKERLKENFIGVDMLTLSATPIPRTLNMAMSGIRDMSTIEQPPFERQPIETYVLEYDKNIIAQAIKKELSRGGQCYYLHNRVDTIENTADKVRQMVPDVRVGVAHGKMTQEELSTVWEQLLDGGIDVLVCTTLIETGIDVRNCNTLIIEDADRMGLSQLYQIRGRVGRSGRKAYAYFTFRRDKSLTDIAGKRLSAIREFTAFGSGFRIAMRDLQIRGAGNLLGHSQHGHMEAVGYELYIRMLSEAISIAKGEPVKRNKADCTIDLPVNAYIPNKYISDSSSRIEAYKRIAAVQNAEDVADVLDELIDRYGEPPPSVSDLVEVSLLRVLGVNLGVKKVTQRNGKLELSLETLQLPVLQNLIENFGVLITAGAGEKPYISYKISKTQKPLEVLREIFKVMENSVA